MQHPHILPLLDSGDAGNGLLYYVMPLVSGETLRARLAREKQLPIDDAILIAREVADALQCAHDQHVIHRDVKPENIVRQWADDGKSVLVRDNGFHIVRVNLATGLRTAVFDLAPLPGTGIIGLSETTVTSHGRMLYVGWQYLSRLFTVDGVR